MWASACLVLIPAMFVGENTLVPALARATGIHVSARFTGGEVISAEERPGYKTLIHRPVFDGLFGKRSTGFIQVDFVRTAAFPPEFEQAVSYDENGTHSFTIKIKTAGGAPRAEISSKDSKVIGLGMLADGASKLLLRVNIRR